MRQKLGTVNTKDDKVIYPIDFLEFQLDEVLRISSHIKDVVFNGQTYIGTGGLSKVDEIVEKGDLSARGAKITMSGIARENVSLVMQAKYRGKIVRRWIGFVNSEDEVLDDGYLLGVWKIDTMSISTGKTAKVTVTAESSFLRASVVRNDRYTNEAQQAKYPDDKGLEFVDQAAKDEF